MNKVLIISYYWPPSAGSGVQRWLKFAKYLPQNNWKPIIYTPKNPYFEVEDEKLSANIPSEIDVWKTSIWEPYTLKDKLLGKGKKHIQTSGVILDQKSFRNRLLNWVRGNFFIPDPKVYWVKPSISYLSNKIQEHKISHIITTGPPHSMHLIGLGLKEEFPNLNWIADFRDPWSEYDLLDTFHLSYLARRKHKRLERSVLQNADVTLTVSETWARDLKRLGAERVELLTNGYDEDDFQNIGKTNDKFIIGHYGLLNHLRNPKRLWSVLNDLCEEHKDFNEKLEIHLSGNIDHSVLSNIKSFPRLNLKVKELGYLSHFEVLKRYNETSILLLLLFNSKSGIGNYPGKIFEYFAARKPILAFGPNKSDVQKLLERVNVGRYFSYESDDVKEYIFDLFNSSNKALINYEIRNYSRKNLTKDLVNILNTLR